MRASRVLVVAAHPDDEVLGAGGAMRRFVAEGSSVAIAFLAEGVTSRPTESSTHQRAVEEREAAARTAAGRLGCTILAFHRLPDNRLDAVPLLEVVQRVEQAKEAFAPEIVFTHHPGDLNIDHRVVAIATCTAFRPRPGESWREVLAFEVPTATDWGSGIGGTPFEPDTYVDVSSTLAAKLDAYRSYADEVPRDPHCRSLASVEYLAKLRGRQVGVDAAEAFVTLRRVVR